MVSVNFTTQLRLSTYSMRTIIAECWAEGNSLSLRETGLGAEEVVLAESLLVPGSLSDPVKSEASICPNLDGGGLRLPHSLLHWLHQILGVVHQHFCGLRKRRKSLFQFLGYTLQRICTSNQLTDVAVDGVVDGVVDVSVVCIYKYLQVWYWFMTAANQLCDVVDFD